VSNSSPDPATLPDALSEQHVAAQQTPLRAAHQLASALETIARARGALLEMHHLIGHADNMLDEVIAELKAADRPDLIEVVVTELLGRDVIPDRWTFQIVEEFDSGYWLAWCRVEERLRGELTGGRRFALEAALKATRQVSAAG